MNNAVSTTVGSLRPTASFPCSAVSANSTDISSDSTWTCTGNAAGQREAGHAAHVG